MKSHTRYECLLQYGPIEEGIYPEYSSHHIGCAADKYVFYEDAYRTYIYLCIIGTRIITNVIKSKMSRNL